MLVKRQIRRLEEPSLRCVELIHEEMQRIIQHCGNEVQQEMLRFPKLHEKIVDVVTQLLRRRLPNTNTMVENIVAIELAYINTKHPDFHKDAALVPSLLKADHAPEPWNQRDPNAQRRTARNNSPAMYNNNVDANVDSQRPNNIEQMNHVDEQQQKTSGWLSNILPPAAPNYNANSKTFSLDSNGSSTTNTPTHNNVMSPLKPVNLLPDVPINPTARKLTDKEQRDCDVIGKNENSGQIIIMIHSKIVSQSFECCSILDFSERLIKSYFYIVRKSIQDSVPKAVMHFLVNYVKDNLQSELVTHLYKSENAEDFLNESDHIAVRRKEAADMLKVSNIREHFLFFYEDQEIN